jgi:hypothetical protein
VVARGADAEPMPNPREPTLKAGETLEAARPARVATGLWGIPPTVQGFGRFRCARRIAVGSLSDTQAGGLCYLRLDWFVTPPNLGLRPAGSGPRDLGVS